VVDAGRPRRARPAELSEALKDALRPIVAELVTEELARAPAVHAPHADEEPSYETPTQYAERLRTTPAAVRARIRRGKLPEAFRPPGAREWLTPNGSEAGRQAQFDRQQRAPAPQQRPGA
jgi:hypothetical protein